MNESKLYRGYLPLSEAELAPRKKSLLDLSQLVEKKTDPHSVEHAEQLLWTTPDIEYAKRIIIARFLTQIALDDSYRQKIKLNPNIKPRIAIYPTTGAISIFDAVEKTLKPIIQGQNLPMQVVAQEIDSDQIEVKVLSETSIRAIFESLNKIGQSDTIGRAITQLTYQTGKDFLQDPSSKDYKNPLSLQEFIKRAYNFYISQGLEPSHVTEALAQGLFSASGLVYKLGKESIFE